MQIEPAYDTQTFSDPNFLNFDQRNDAWCRQPFETSDRVRREVHRTLNQIPGSKSWQDN